LIRQLQHGVSKDRRPGYIFNFPSDEPSVIPSEMVWQHHTCTPTRNELTRFARDPKHITGDFELIRIASALLTIRDNSESFGLHMVSFPRNKTGIIMDLMSGMDSLSLEKGFVTR
jgi:hypothetical protein